MSTNLSFIKTPTETIKHRAVFLFLVRTQHLLDCALSNDIKRFWTWSHWQSFGRLYLFSPKWEILTIINKLYEHKAEFIYFLNFLCFFLFSLHSLVINNEIENENGVIKYLIFFQDMINSEIFSIDLAI